MDMASRDSDLFLLGPDETSASALREKSADHDHSGSGSRSDPTTFALDVVEKALSDLTMAKAKAKQRMAQKHGDAEDLMGSRVLEKLVKDGKLDKLKVVHFKVYLEKHGLRCTGTKEVLLNRIKEHLKLKNGSAEKMYPVSSFTMNCQGDSCVGDVVLFEQRVYGMFNVGAQRATGPPLGKRTIAGRIVHDSYGQAKQQHTFTIEVLWSRGEKPWPPLHPLLIKGRNLYRTKTMRQKWEHEEDRTRILEEKHNRGNIARSSRDRRIRVKEFKKNRRDHWKMEKSPAKGAIQPTPLMQDVTNMIYPEQPNDNFACRTHAHVPREPQTRPSSQYSEQSNRGNCSVSGPSPREKENECRRHVDQQDHR